MAFLAAAVPFLAAGAKLVQGVGGFMAGQHNKKVLKAQAREELAAAQEQEREQRKDARRAIGAQLAAQWGNGFEGGSGTAVDAIRESQIEAALDAREIRRQGIGRAKSLRSQASQAAREGAFSLASGLLGAATDYADMRHDWAQARTGTTARPQPGTDY